MKKLDELLTSGVITSVDLKCGVRLEHYEEKDSNGIISGYGICGYIIDMKEQTIVESIFWSSQFILECIQARIKERISKISTNIDRIDSAIKELDDGGEEDE